MIKPIHGVAHVRWAEREAAKGGAHVSADAQEWFSVTSTYFIVHGHTHACRAEREAAKGGAQVSAAAQEREASLVSSIAELQASLAAAENDAANREEALR